MDNSSGKKSKGKNRRRNLNFGDREKSSSEPDLSDYAPAVFSDRWKKQPNEGITVDELKFYRRRKPSDLHTRSSICLYNTSEPTIEFSALKTEYQRQFGDTPQLTPRPALRRRSTSLKLLDDTEPLAVTMAAATASEQQSEFQAYTEGEVMRCRRSLAKNPDHYYRKEQLLDDSDVAAAGLPPLHFDGNIRFMSEPHFDAKQKQEPSTKHASQICHLNLEGDLSYVPEYKSQFVTFPIEKSQSIPQISNITFQGKFGGVAEYRDSFRTYDQYVKSAPIKKPGHLTVKTTIEGDGDAGEYAEKYRAPDRSTIERSVLAKKSDQFHLLGEDVDRKAEYSESFTDPKIIAHPERPKARAHILSLKGNMDYSPEYRATYVDFPRTRPTVHKPASSIKLGETNPNKAVVSNVAVQKFESNPLIKNVHEPILEDLSFMCQPEVRRAKKEMLIKERHAYKEPATKTVDVTVSGSASDDLNANKSALPPASARGEPLRYRNVSPSFKLTVKNVDDPGGTFKKTTPKFGRRSSIGKEAHRLRNRTKIIEGNREYVEPTPDHRRKSTRDGPSFVVLNEPCKQSKWMKPLWYS